MEFFFNFKATKLTFTLEEKTLFKLRNAIQNFNQTNATKEFGEGFEDYMWKLNCY